MTTENIRKIFAKKLKKARELKGVSQRELGLLTGLSDKSISAYEQGRVMPPLDILPKLAKHLNQSVSYFLNEETSIDRIMVKIDELDQVIESLKSLLPQVKNDLVSNLEKVSSPTDVKDSQTK